VDDAVASVMHECLREDFDAARRELRRLTPEELKRLRRAAMALQNLATARLYMLAQQAGRRTATRDFESASSANREAVQAAADGSQAIVQARGR
jgi:hypothetical protein